MPNPACAACGKNHNPARPHCPACGRATKFHVRDTHSGWGCYPYGCGFWMPDDPTRSIGRFGERHFCLDHHKDTPHHFWIYDDEQHGRQGAWFCVECFGPIEER